MTTVFRGFAACCALAALQLAGMADAALIDRGGGMIYDTDQDITWLADTNLPLTLDPGDTDFGRMTWSAANSFAANTVYGGFDDWRLPVGSTCYGYDCTDSEMGHLFYVDLGGVAGLSVGSADPDQDPVPPDPDVALFGTFEQDYYWTSTQYDLDPNGYRAFDFDGGHQGLGHGELKNFYVMLVRDGDVLTAVPVPAAAWLLGSGLLGMLGLARTKRA